MANQGSNKEATLYRMMTPKHSCPFGLKTLDLLKREGYEVEDHHLESREDIDAFKQKHDVKTTPQTFINGQRIGGYEDVRKFLGKKVRDKSKPTYRPVIALFSLTALTALVLNYSIYGSLISVQAVEWFIALSMVVLALLKLQDIEAFSTMFLNYDLLAKRWVPYGYIYPFGEALAGILMVGGILNWISVPVALFIAGIGAVSVFKAVYIDKRELKCACVGGNNNVPLGFISLTENLMMIGMALWMWFGH
ncbi:Glutaredoxin [Pseudidiomarina planktonica]|uniref:Methylamine utilization protein MauE n=1 Tax=Pseudidiomarina planktonica TaxID=1323738 RepID=A0A1Y6G356_9GAMM|nr:glutaredoxin [Pseudidiomarina planktonica]RUO63929.1 glutaredoxin [Pseudidiomarina planktonica]SMQ79990.1 Glutaredoxin [Pseudidiomarina planktonica]